MNKWRILSSKTLERACFTDRWYTSVPIYKVSSKIGCMEEGIFPVWKRFNWFQSILRKVYNMMMFFSFLNLSQPLFEKTIEIFLKFENCERQFLTREMFHMITLGQIIVEDYVSLSLETESYVLIFWTSPILVNEKDTLFKTC